MNLAYDTRDTLCHIDVCVWRFGPQQQQPGGQEQEQELLTSECLNRRNQRHQPLTETLQFNENNNSAFTLELQTIMLGKAVKFLR